MKRLLFLCLTIMMSIIALSQKIPQGFNYQAVLRDAAGSIISNEEVTVELSVEDDLGAEIWVESHSATSNQFGLISLIMGEGTRLGGTAAGFAEIDWSGQQTFIRTIVVYDDNRIDMGASEIMSVPYSLVSKTAEGISGELNNLGIVESVNATEGEPLFEVKNNGGQTVFAVYNEGVEIYIDDSEEKGIKGSFAVKGFGDGKAGETNYMIVNGDSARIYIDNENDLIKGIKGGFAVQGFKDVTKGDTEDYLRITRDSTRIYINDNSGDKGIKGSFAVQGFGDTKGDNANYFDINMDETSSVINPAENRILWYPQRNAFLTGRVLIEDANSVGENAFVSGYKSRAKGDYSQAMGYKAYADGMNSTSIGMNSLAEGANSYAFGQDAGALALESYAIGKGAVAEETGQYSYAIGKNATVSATSGYALGTDANSAGASSFALGLGASTNSSGTNAYAIGEGAQANGQEGYAIGKDATVSAASGYALGTDASSAGANSYALGLGASTGINGANAYAIGEGAQANAQESYAIGRGAIATGLGSFAFGSAGLDSVGNSTGVVQANGNYSVAIGQGAYTSNEGSIAIGVGTRATGKFANSMGYETYSSGHASFAAGSKTTASNSYATAFGYSSRATGFASTALGWSTRANLNASFAAGYYSEAQTYMSTAMGVHAIASGHSSMAMGNYVTARSYGETVFGMYNTEYTPYTTTYSYPTDRLFVVGNGTHDVPSDALVILKKGNVGIGNPSLNTLNQYSLAIQSSNRGINVNTTSSASTYSIASTASEGSTTYAFYGNANSASSENYGIKVLSYGSATTNYGIHAYASGATYNYAGYFSGNVYSTGTITQASDARFKTNIENIENSLSTLMRLNGVIYNWREDEFPEMGFDNNRHLGVIAQEVEQVLPELVETDENGYKSVAYSKLTPLLIEAVKEQQNEIESLKAENKILMDRMEAIEELLDL